MRSRHHVEEGRGDRRSIVLTEIPYQVGKNGLVEKIAEAAKDKRIEGVSDIRDESNRAGRAHRHRAQARRDARKSCSTSCGGTRRPSRASRQTCSRSAAAGPRRWRSATSSRRSSRFREEVITRRSKFELFKARERAHILLGLVVAVTNLDEVVRLIRGSASPGRRPARRCSRANGPSDADPALHRAGRGGRAAGGRRNLSRCREAQVKAILDLRLHRLTALGRDEIGNELRRPREESSPSCSRSSATGSSSMR